MLGFHLEGMTNSFLRETVLFTKVVSSCSVELVDGTGDAPVELREAVTKVSLW